MSFSPKSSTPLRVGITGGIGSGKSTVCACFAALGIPIYNADDRAKALMVQNIAVIEQILDIFGLDAYNEDGSLNRSIISTQAFSDKSKLTRLNAVVHPAVAQDYAHWHKGQANAPYTLKEAALLVESGSYQSLDDLIVVVAPEDVRIQRVMARDQSSAEAVKARIKNQASEAELRSKATFVIENSGELPLIPQVVAIHRQIMGKL